MHSSADGSRRPHKSLIDGLTRFKTRASTTGQTAGRGGAGNATTSMLSPSGNSLAENMIRSPVGRDIRLVPRSGQILKTGRGGAGSTTSAKASKRRMSELEIRAVLAAEKEVVEQHKREKAVSSPLVTGRGGMGNIRKSKQGKSKLSPTLSQPHRSSTSQIRSSSISSFVLDISAEASTSSCSRLSGVELPKRRHSFSDLSITEPRGTTLPSLSPGGPETHHPWSITDSSFTDRTGYAIPESTFGALAEAHEGIASDHWTSISTRCYAGSANPSLTETDGNCYHRRLPSSVSPLEEPPMFFYLTPMTPSSSQQLQRRSVSINPAKECDSRPPTGRTSTSSPPFSSSISFDKYYTPEPRTSPNPVIMLPPEQVETPISPLSPPPRLSSPTSDSTPALSPRSPLSASSAPRVVGYRTALDTYGFREDGGSRPSTSGSNHRPRTADSAIEMESGRSYKQKEVALWRLKTPNTLISRISGQSGAPFIPLEAIVNPPPRSAKTVNAGTSSPISAVNLPMRPIKIPGTPPQIPISIFVDPPSHGHSVARPSPTSPLTPSFRSTSPASQYESFTPTFGARPLPPLPSASRRTTYTSLAPSEYTFPSSPTSPVSVVEEETTMLAQPETRW